MASIERVISSEQKRLDHEKKEQAIEALTGKPGKLINQAKILAQLLTLIPKNAEWKMADKTDRFVAFAITPKDVQNFIKY
jgi:hypothetical protein